MFVLPLSVDRLVEPKRGDAAQTRLTSSISRFHPFQSSFPPPFTVLPIIIPIYNDKNMSFVYTPREYTGHLSGIVGSGFMFGELLVGCIQDVADVLLFRLQLRLITYWRTGNRSIWHPREGRRTNVEPNLHARDASRYYHDPHHKFGISVRGVQELQREPLPHSDVAWSPSLFTTGSCWHRHHRRPPLDRLGHAAWHYSSSSGRSTD